MTSSITVIGCDPGVTSGVCVLALERDGDGPLRITGRSVFACNAAEAPGLVSWIIMRSKGKTVIGAGEKFVRGQGAGARQNGAAVTWQVIDGLSALDIPWHWRPAVTVKAWSVNLRLAKAGLLDMTAKSADARDAARHALYCAALNCGLADPLSRRQSP